MKFTTDLAVERKEMLDADSGGKKDHDGIAVKEYLLYEDISCTKIIIENEEGSKKLERPIGTYITLQVQGILDGDDAVKENAVEALAGELKKLIPFHYNLKVMVVGLGNENVTPDALGPATASQIRVTRHLFHMYGADGDDNSGCVSCVIPGVTAMTGIETAELIKSAAELTRPDVTLVIDSLAARNIERVSTTIQINDTGIEPGSGMGNIRKVINEEYLGCRVVAIGVPTVIDAATIMREALESHIDDALEIDEYIEEHRQELVVTSTDIDQLIEDFSDIISKAVNKTLHPGIYS